jgi:peptide/nickel transport system permease protein
MTAITAPRRRHGNRSLLRRVAAQPAGLIGLIIVGSALTLAVIAPALAPHSIDTIDMSARLSGPSSDHLLGTDDLGRDNFSRALIGIRYAMGIAIPAVVLAFVVGVIIGMVSGYMGGWFDRVIVVVTDSLLSFPSVILALTVITLIGPSVRNTILVIAVSFLPYYVRLARSQAMAAKHSVYVKAERSLGASNTRILLRHMFPNIIPPLLVVMAMDIPNAVVVEAGLAFLGLGVPPPTPDWGVLINEGFVNINGSMWPLVGPLAALVILTTGFSLIGETLRDVTDPRFAGSRRRLIQIGRPTVQVR